MLSGSVMQARRLNLCSADQERQKMQKLGTTLGVISRMTRYGAVTGVLLGLLYFWVAPVIGILVGFVVGTVTGMFEGLLIAAFTSLVRATSAQVGKYRHLVGAINGTIATVVTALSFYYLLSGGGHIQIADPLAILLLIMLPMVIAGIAAWLSSAKTVTWVQSQGDAAIRPTHHSNIST